MNPLYSGSLYWPTTLKTYRTYPALEADARVRVAIVGGGLSGALCAYMLAKSGIEAMVLERGESGCGSSSANTGLLQFSNDIMLTDLMEQIGELSAIRFYKACKQAVEQLAEIAATLGTGVEFVKRRSLYYATTEQHVPKLKREYETLKAGGFDAEYWEPDQIASRFPFRKPGAIVTSGDAEMNSFKFVRGVIDAAAQMGVTVCEHTDVIAHETLENGLHRLRTANGCAVEAEHVVYSVGYEPEQLHDALIKPAMRYTYVVVTEPVRDLSAWYERCLIWETARPYIYMRTSADGRIIVGGMDEALPAPVRDDSARRQRTDKLYKVIREHFPMFTAPTAYEWGALFADSRDNLPFIGEDPARPRVYYCLGYGGNGNIYSMIGAMLVRNLIRGENHPIAGIVRLDRPTLQEV